jgi:hypothetical protein
MTKLEAGQQRDDAEATKERKAAELQFGQGLGKGGTADGAMKEIAHFSTTHLN